MTGVALSLLLTRRLGARPAAGVDEGGEENLLEWDAVDEDALEGYRVYYGTTSGTYSQNPGEGIDVGNVLEYDYSGLAVDTYFFYVVWYDEAGNESPASAELEKDRV